MSILHLKERVKKQDINRVIGTKGKDRNKVFNMVGSLSTLENNNNGGRKVREKELILAIDKPELSPIIILTEAIYDS